MRMYAACGMARSGSVEEKGAVESRRLEREESLGGLCGWCGRRRVRVDEEEADVVGLGEDDFHRSGQRKGRRIFMLLWMLWWW